MKRAFLNPSSFFTFLAFMSLLFWWRALSDTLMLAATNEAYTHILLILPLSLALAYLDLKGLNENNSALECKGSKSLLTSTPRARGTGAALLLLAMLLGGYTRGGMKSAPGDIRLALEMFSLVMWWVGSVIGCFGIRVSRCVLLPLGLLFLLVPLPALFLDIVVRGLQHGSAWMAAILFHAVGEPVQRDGIFLHLTGLDVEVAKECSSIRSSCLLVITTVVLAHLYLRSWWRRATLVLIAIPLSIAKNGLRIFAIAELGIRVDPGYLQGSFHHHGGIVFLLIALFAIVTLLTLFHRSEGQMTMLRPAAPA